MIKNECKIISDLLSLYAEDMLTDESREFVEEHILSCSECKEKFEKIKENEICDNKISAAAPLKLLKKQLFIKKATTAAMLVILTFIVVLTCISHMTSADYISKEEAIEKIFKDENGNITIKFNSNVTNVENIALKNENNENIYYISANSATLWDKITGKIYPNGFTMSFEEDSFHSLYYLWNNSAPPVFLYGNESLNDVGIIHSRLALSYYFIAAVVLTLLAVAAFAALRKKEKAKKFFELFLPLPISYIAAHILIKGFVFSSYSLQRDLLLLIPTTILIYFEILFVVKIYKSRKQDKGAEY